MSAQKIIITKCKKEMTLFYLNVSPYFNFVDIKTKYGTDTITDIVFPKFFKLQFNRTDRAPRFYS